MSKMKKPASTDAGGFVDKKGQYHLQQLHAKPDQISSKKGSVYTKITFQVLAGTEASQVGRIGSIDIYEPSETQKDGGERCSIIQWRAADALCLISGREQPGDEVEINWPEADGVGQCIAYIDMEAGADGKEYARLDGAHIYHVDDPAVAHVPKSNPALRLLPHDRRRTYGPDGKTFRIGATAASPQGAAAANGTNKTPPKQTAAAGAASSGAAVSHAADLGDL